MKKLALCILSICFSIQLAAQDRKIEMEIRNLEKTESEAILKNDTITLSKLWDKQYIVNSPDNVITLAGKSVAERPVLQRKRNNFLREVEKIIIQDDVVISMGNETVVLEGESNSNKTIKRRYTNVWKNKEGEWKLVARHASIICR